MDDQLISFLIGLAPYIFGTTGLLGFVYFFLSYLQKSNQSALEHFEKNKVISKLVQAGEIESADQRAEYLEKTAPTWRIRRRWRKYRREIIRRERNIIKYYQDIIDEYHRKLTEPKHILKKLKREKDELESKLEYLSSVQENINNNLDNTRKYNEWRMIKIFKLYEGFIVKIGDNCSISWYQNWETVRPINSLVAHQYIGESIKISLSENNSIQLTDSEHISCQVHFTKQFSGLGRSEKHYLCLLYITCGSEVPDEPVKDESLIMLQKYI